MHRALARALDKLAAIVACVLVTTLLICVAAGALTRTIGEPLASTDELSRFLMVWLAALGWILASRRRIHVRIRFFHDRLPSGAHRATEIVIQAAMTLFGALVAAYGVVLVDRNHDLEATTLPISMAWMYAPVAAAGAVTALQGVIELGAALRPSQPRARIEKASVE
jgi:TRAP-type C4-dicarboxylate transport system permease small subunit